MKEINTIAECSDPAPVAELRWAWARESDPTVPPGSADAAFVESIADWMHAPSRTVWVAFTESSPVGMVCMTEYTRMPSPRAAASGSWGYLGHLFVRPERRGSGIGQHLIAQVLDHADEQRYSKVVLSPSAPSIPLYARCGFSIENNMMVRRASIQ